MSETTPQSNIPVRRGLLDFFSSISGRYSGLIFPIALLVLLTIMMVPIPTWIMDVSLAFSLSLSIVILITVVMMESFHNFTSFPSLLLVATLLRLSLNVASTRLILTSGHTGTDAAGSIIQAFGNVIVSGNYVIGFIVFLVLVIINFVVITKGSGRIAEVTARFTLDALPGKQMAIDADLSSGLIDEDGARKRRKLLDEQSTFFGSMDGASKFVRGDAIAGLLITFINIIGGILVGSLQNNMTVAEAARNYTILTIGDGLVTQIPTLLISVSAGMLVTKATSDVSTDSLLASQLTSRAQSWWLIAVTLFVFALIPGMPAVPFMILSASTAVIAWVLTRRERLQNDLDSAAKIAADKKEKPDESPISETLQMDIVRLELGYGLLPIVNSDNGNQLPSQVKALRKQFAEEFGVVLPAIRIQDNLKLPTNSYVITIKEIRVGEGDLYPDQLLVMNPQGKGEVDLSGQEAKEPIFGLKAKWIAESLRDEAHFRGYTVVKPSTVITTHLAEILKDHLADLLTYTEVRKLLEQLPEVQRKLVEELVPNRISYSFIQQVLKSLLLERVSIRDLGTIIEAIGEAHSQSSSHLFVVEYVRTRLARQICHGQLNSENILELVVLSPTWEQRFQESMVGEGENRQFVMPPSQVQAFIQATHKYYEQAAQRGQLPSLMVLPSLRPYVRGLVERFRPQTVVLSQNEIYTRIKIRSVGVIE